ncbi:MAG: FAD-dependent monooxygenase [Chloroflexales bacterium]|nr:FAD-dependent monooxygenase [Chloroflexales bacterium]
MATNNQPLFSHTWTKGHAIVIGGSIAGILAAQVLSDYFARVTVIDRDTFPDAPAHRKGAPQSHHAHGLLIRGHMIIEQLFPGITAELRANGASSARNVVPLALVSPAGKLRSEKVNDEFIAFSRYFMEWHIRQRLAKQEGVRFITNCEVTELLTTADRQRVTGICMRQRGADDRIETLQADLVVDASGRHSKTPEWLVRMGYAAPPEENINSDIGYASRFYARPADFPAEWEGIIINGRPPHNPRAGLILPIEHNRWHVTMGGFAGHYPPTDEAGFLQWARDLADPSIYEAIRVAEPITPIRGYRTPENRLRHFERLDRWPQRFIAMGDSVCAFNPIYGQGMTTSALGALALDESLHQQLLRPRSDFERQFQRRIAQTVAAPWLIATGEDLRWEGIRLRGARPRLGLRLLHNYMNLVLQQAREDLVVSQAYANVLHMLDTPESLMHPRVLIRVFAGTLGRLFGNAPSNPNDPGPFALSPEAIANLQARKGFHNV